MSPIYLDASPLYTFCHRRVSAVDELRGYLEDRARVSTVVSEEIRKGAEWPDEDDEFKELLRTIVAAGWPTSGPALSPDLEREVLRRAKALRRPGDRETSHIGEIATVVQAREEQAPLVVMDDRDGHVAAERDGVEAIRSEILAAEMVAEDALPHAKGFSVAEEANTCTKNMWNQHVAFARANR